MEILKLLLTPGGITVLGFVGAIFASIGYGIYKAITRSFENDETIDETVDFTIKSDQQLFPRRSLARLYNFMLEEVTDPNTQ